jgi:hypothetical protein
MSAHNDRQGVRLKLALSLVTLVSLVALPAEALEWRWSYQGEGLSASGSFTTVDAPNADGFYEITGIKGEMNGVSITGLQKPATSIPANDGYPVDNLVRSEKPQLSENGFGFAFGSGAYANPFYGAHFAPPGFIVVLPDPRTGKLNEPRITFSAEIVH